MTIQRTIIGASAAIAFAGVAGADELKLAHFSSIKYHLHVEMFVLAVGAAGRGHRRCTQPFVSIQVASWVPVRPSSMTGDRRCCRHRLRVAGIYGFAVPEDVAGRTAGDHSRRRQQDRGDLEQYRTSGRRVSPDQAARTVDNRECKSPHGRQEDRKALRSRRSQDPRAIKEHRKAVEAWGATRGVDADHAGLPVHGPPESSTERWSIRPS